jgi:hypothetical protein
MLTEEITLRYAKLLLRLLAASSRFFENKELSAILVAQL